MGITITMLELYKRKNWIPMIITKDEYENETVTYDKNTRGTRSQILQKQIPNSYPVYDFDEDDPIKILYIRNAIKEDPNTGECTSTPEMAQILANTDTFAMITRNTNDIMLIGTLDPEKDEDKEIESKYLLRKGYIYFTKALLNENNDDRFKPLNNTIEYLTKLESKEKPLDPNNPEDFALILEMYEEAYQKSLLKID